MWVTLVIRKILGFCQLKKAPKKKIEALESVMCDVIKIRLKRRIATRSGKGKRPLNIKQL